MRGIKQGGRAKSSKEKKRKKRFYAAFL